MRKFKTFSRGLGLLLVVVIGVAAWIALPWFVWLVLAALFALWLLATRAGRQAGSVTWVGLGTLPSRMGSASVVVIGIAGVVGVLVALLAMGEGYQATLAGTGSRDTAIVLRGGSAAEVMSVLSNDNINVIEQAPGIARDARGKPIASPELVVAANLPIRGGAADEDGSVQFRGVGEEAWVLRSNVRIIAGRKFKPGMRELDVGVDAQRKFAGLEVGRTIKLGNQEWTVVGVFASGDALDSEIWGDADIVAGAYRRGSSRNAVTLRLASSAAFDQFQTALKADPRLNVDISTTLDYYAKQSEGMMKVIRIIGVVVGAIMGIGALFGALNTMYASVATRAREIATLRAVGFRGLPVVIAVMLETMLLALCGGIVGGLLAWAIFNGYTASTIAGGVGQLTFHLKVSPMLLWTGIKWALAIGFIGGLFPAVRAARLPVTTALREL
jgi:putative ABC transport system permease protein